MKNQNENQNETKTKPTEWTNDKIVSYVIELGKTTEKHARDLETVMIDMAVIKTGIYVSPDLLTDDKVRLDKQPSPPDQLINLVLNLRGLAEKADILRIKISHIEDYIKYFRAITESRIKK